MFLTIHRGSSQIGGSCVELSCSGHRIIIDAGRSLDAAEENARPAVRGLFVGAPEEKPVDALIISHAHQDHYGHLNEVRADVPVYLSTGTRKLIELTGLYTGRYRVPENAVTFDAWSPFSIGPFTITPHLVDHSAFDAFAFEVAAGGVRVFYSGDFRDHGRLGKTLNIMGERCAPGVDALVMEGTMLGRAREEVRTEDALVEDIAEICRRCNKAVLVCQSGQNVTRAVTFAKAAKLAGREFVHDVYTAHVAHELGRLKGGALLPFPGNGAFGRIRVWRRDHARKLLFATGHDKLMYHFARFNITPEEMRGAWPRLMVLVRPGMQEDLRAIGELEGAVLIYSQWQGYLKEETPMKRFVDDLAEMGVEMVPIHTSGHATIPALQRMVDLLRPKELIAIHTQYPHDYPRFGVPVCEAKDGQTISIGAAATAPCSEATA